jgi:hypothetical protein
VGHDDLEVYERSQQALLSRGRDWVNIGRLYDPAETTTPTQVVNGTSELQMRNQYRTWARYMAMGPEAKP